MPSRPIRLLPIAAAMGCVILAGCQDAVTGLAKTGSGRQSVEFVFDARSGPSGESPRGTVSMNTFFGDLGDLPVGCLSVKGDRAEVVAVIDSTSPNAAEAVAIQVQDGGRVGPDRLTWTWLWVPPTGCTAPTTAGDPISAGDIAVGDGQPPSGAPAPE
jgi:hypothetical protein